jgi:hypothetical protein
MHVQSTPFVSLDLQGADVHVVFREVGGNASRKFEYLIERSRAAR